jgi:SAM-dependent methyltransferase
MTEASNIRPAGDRSIASSRRPRADLFLISFLILFFELACIRWFGATVVFLSFFTNIVLMACFLGMSIGCLAASRRINFARSVIPLTLLAVLLACATRWGYDYFGRVTIDVGAQQESPQLIFFGTEYRPKDPSKFIIPIEAVAGTFYGLIALIFVGLGQIMGRAFNAIPRRLTAYTLNIAGSLAGILAFAGASYSRADPTLWFVVVGGLCLYFVRPRTAARRFSQVAGLLLLIAFTADVSGQRIITRWSPYSKVSYEPRTGGIGVNSIAHQQMLRIMDWGPAYALPHLLNRDAGGAAFENVLIIGAGSGNDVQAALAFGAKHVDAVEIDPVIYDIGRADHPDRPYDDPRVSVHLDDGRSFLARTPRKYDVVIYALVDSLVLHSGYSSIRLESFLFTEEAFRAVKRVLKPGGVFAMYNYYRQGWVVGRLARMAENVFGSPPIVSSMPHQERITPGDNQKDHITFLLVGNTPEAAEPLRSKFAASDSFWLNEQPQRNLSINGFAAVAPATETAPSHTWRRIAPALVESASIDRLPSDDWPFLYLRERRIPLLNLRGAAIMAGLSLLVLLLIAPIRTVRPNGQMFFLGAGFMLLETKSVVHMALLFGATWIVNSVVFFAILVMILLANVFVLTVKPRRLWPFYVLLLAALIVHILVPMNSFLALSGAARTLASCGVVFVPIFFAGVIFATAFRDSTRPDIDFGSNIAGVILGGLSEYASMVLGFNHLLIVAIAYYFLSMLLRRRVVAPSVAAA